MIDAYFTRHVDTAERCRRDCLSAVCRYWHVDACLRTFAADLSMSFRRHVYLFYADGLSERGRCRHDEPRLRAAYYERGA